MPPEFPSEEDRQEVFDLLRRLSSAKRYGYQRLLEGCERGELKKHLSGLFQINTRYADDTIWKANQVLDSCRRRGQNPAKVVFGGRDLFEKLLGGHLTGRRREELVEEWRERRQGTLCARGDRSKQGNLNLRFVRMDGDLYLRNSVGSRRWVLAGVVRSAKKNEEKDKWAGFIGSRRRRGDPCLQAWGGAPPHRLIFRTWFS